MSLIDIAVAIGGLFAGVLFAVVLHVAGMPSLLIVISAIIVGLSAVLLASRKTRVFNKPQTEEAGAAEEVSA